MYCFPTIAKAQVTTKVGSLASVLKSLRQERPVTQNNILIKYSRLQHSVPNALPLSITPKALHTGRLGGPMLHC